MAIRDNYGYVRKTLNIGTWNMDTGALATVAHGLSSSEFLTIRSLEAIIVNDATTALLPLMYGSPADGSIDVDSTFINLIRTAAGGFDSASYATTPSVNGTTTRGYVTFEYIPD